MVYPAFINYTELYHFNVFIIATTSLKPLLAALIVFINVPKTNKLRSYEGICSKSILSEAAIFLIYIVYIKKNVLVHSSSSEDIFFCCFIKKMHDIYIYRFIPYQMSSIFIKSTQSIVINNLLIRYFHSK